MRTDVVGFNTFFYNYTERITYYILSQILLIATHDLNYNWESTKCLSRVRRVGVQRAWKIHFALGGNVRRRWSMAWRGVACRVVPMPPGSRLALAAPVGNRQLNLAPLRATNWKNIQLHLAKYWIISWQITILHWGRNTISGTFSWGVHFRGSVEDLGCRGKDSLLDYRGLFFIHRKLRPKTLLNHNYQL